MGEHEPDEPFDEAGEVAVESGVDLLDGPGGVAIALTPSAARSLGEKLIAAADEASS